MMHAKCWKEKKKKLQPKYSPWEDYHSEMKEFLREVKAKGIYHQWTDITGTVKGNFLS